MPKQEDPQLRPVDRTLGSNEPILCRDGWHAEVRDPAEPPTDAPDLRTLVAMQRAAFDAAFPGLPPGLNPEEARRRVNAALAAVLPAHRRQVLAEAADLVGAIPVTRTHLNEGDHVRDAAVRILRRLAATVPETGPSGRVAADTGPAVPEATPHARGREEMLAEVLTALEDEGALRAWYVARHPYACIDIGAGRFFAEYLAERFDAKEGTDG